MKNNSDNPLGFPLSLGEAAGPEVEGPSRFARALKRARFAWGWTQAMLAEQLAIPKRSIVSWETGERIPGIGMVMLLLDVLFPEEEPSFQRELITAYIADDLERQEQRKETRDPCDPLRQRIQRVMAQVLQRSTGATLARPHVGRQEDAVAQASEQQEERELPPPQEARDEQQTLEPLFALMAQLRQHPELIPVTSDFIRELAPPDQ